MRVAHLDGHRAELREGILAETAHVDQFRVNKERAPGGIEVLAYGEVTVRVKRLLPPVHVDIILRIVPLCKITPVLYGRGS